MSFNKELPHLKIMFTLLLIYHPAEYFIHRYIHPEQTRLTSFLITYHYVLAFSCGTVEYLIESYFFPSMKDKLYILTVVGVVMTCIGLYFRFAAILTARRAFTHEIRTKKDDSIKLVTHGVYGIFRHPSYFGYLLFAVGTQIFLANIVSPFCFYAILFNFFKNRIAYEEKYLVSFYGKDYDEYREKVPSGIPFIK